MTFVVAREGEHIDKLLRRFKKKVETAGILKDARRREHYEKPSIKRKRKSIAAKKRAMKKVRKTN